MKQAHCSLRARQRPGIIESFIQPTKLKGQVVQGTRSTPIRFTPRGMRADGPQWVAKVMRPGIVAATMVAKGASASAAPTAANGMPAAAAAAIASGLGRYSYGH
jgi:hypothetical protein